MSAYATPGPTWCMVQVNDPIYGWSECGGVVALEKDGWFYCAVHLSVASLPVVRRSHHYQTQRKSEVCCSGCGVLYEDVDSVKVHQEADGCSRR